MKPKILRIKEWLGKPRNLAICAGVVILTLLGAGLASLIGGQNKPEPSYEPIVIEGSEGFGQQTIPSSSAATPAKTKQTPPRFDRYIGMTMNDIAKELGVTYDATYSTQIKAVKDGYVLMVEDGGKENPADPLKNIATGKATYASIELDEMGKCSQSQAYDRIDEAMRLVGLDPASKGEKHTGGGKGYGAFRPYVGKPSLEIALQCLYDGDNYELLIKVLLDYR